MRGSGKIVIRPRNARKSQPSPSLEPEPEPEASEHSEEGTEQQQEEDVDTVENSEGGEDAQEGSQKDDNMDVDEGGDEEDGDAVQESAPAPRGRGRGRGRGRARGYVSTGRPRGRPRGSGRGRGRGRGRGSSVLLKLPRRGADSDGTGDVDDAEDSQAATPGADDIETSEPIAGGKPFRRIQGQVYVIEDDEFITDNDPKGDEKIDANGNLLGGRKSKLARKCTLTHYMCQVESSKLRRLFYRVATQNASICLPLKPLARPDSGIHSTISVAIS